MSSKGFVLISALLYADDTALIASSSKELCDMVKILDGVMSGWGLTISMTKTKVMVWYGRTAGGGETTTVHKGGTSGRGKVYDFKYLGSLVTNQAGDSRDLDMRISKAWGCSHRLKHKVWRQKALKVETKMQVYR